MARAHGVVLPRRRRTSGPALKDGRKASVPEGPFGERLEECAIAGAGDFLFIPAGVPHLPFNPSSEVPAVTVLARSDASEQESTTPLPELDAIAADRLE